MNPGLNLKIQLLSPLLILSILFTGCDRKKSGQVSIKPSASPLNTAKILTKSEELTEIAEALINAEEVEIENKNLTEEQEKNKVRLSIESEKSKDFLEKDGRSQAVIDLLNEAYQLDNDNKKALFYLLLFSIGKEINGRNKSFESSGFQSQLNNDLKRLNLIDTLPEMALLPDSLDDIIIWLEPQDDYRRINQELIKPAIKLLDLIKNDLSSSSTRCVVTNDGDDNSHIDCKVVESQNPNRLKNFRITLASLAIYLDVYAAFGGIEELREFKKWYDINQAKHLNNRSSFMNDEVFAKAKTYPKLLVVESPEILRSMLMLRKEIGQMSPQIIKAQESLCSHLSSHIFQEFCFSGEVQKQLEIGLALIGSAQRIEIEYLEALFDISPLLKGKLDDLKILIPESVDADGFVDLSSYDFSLHGLFPEGDLAKALNQ